MISETDDDDLREVIFQGYRIMYGLSVNNASTLLPSCMAVDIYLNLNSNPGMKNNTGIIAK
jgi:hypothetical protein